MITANDKLMTEIEYYNTEEAKMSVNHFWINSFLWNSYIDDLGRIEDGQPVTKSDRGNKLLSIEEREVTKFNLATMPIDNRNFLPKNINQCLEMFNCEDIVLRYNSGAYQISYKEAQLASSNWIILMTELLEYIEIEGN